MFRSERSIFGSEEKAQKKAFEKRPENGSLTTKKGVSGSFTNLSLKEVQRFWEIQSKSEQISFVRTPRNPDLSHEDVHEHASHKNPFESIAYTFYTKKYRDFDLQIHAHNEHTFS